MLDTVIRIYTHQKQDRNFYAEMGSYFASLDIKKELENQIYNKNNSTWFIQYNSINEILGFCALFENSSYIYLDNFYILPQYRGNGYADKLFKVRLDYIKQNFNVLKIKAITKTPEMFTIYEKYNFTHAGNNGRYRKYQKEGGAECQF